MTWFYALWVYHKGDGWTVWLGCPKDKIVRLVRLFRLPSPRHRFAGCALDGARDPLHASIRRAQPQRRLRP